ncbi:hypothetical protein ACTHOQ_14165 [Solibacillus silvestris]|uniref:hypothetical protein n=1 Tax=Solibacillus silvestris TaxID=76853 RepID=UPI003F7E2D7C
MTNPFIDRIGYENNEFARIDWYDENAIKVHHTFCYDEDDVETAYYNYLMPGSIYSQWHPKIIFMSKPIQREAASISCRAS